MTRTAIFDADITEDEGGVFDISFDSEGDILTKDFFDTAIKMTIYCEQRALASEMADSERRRGWIGNESTPGFEIGSKTWLFYQSRLTRTTLNQLAAEHSAAFQWMINEGIALSIQSAPVISGGGIGTDILAQRSSSAVDKRYFDLWNNTGV